MLYKTDIKLTENERLSISSKYHACFFYSLRLFVLSFILCLFLSFSVASADPMSVQSKQDFVRENTDSQFYPYLNEIFASCSDFFYTKNSDTRYVFYFVMNPSVVINNLQGNNSRPNAALIQNVIGTTNYTGQFYLYRLARYDSYFTIQKCVSNDYYSAKGSIAYYKCSVSYVLGSAERQITGYGYTSSVALTSSNAYQGGVTYSTVYTWAQNGDFPDYVSDDRLKLYTTQSSSNGSLLHVDLSEFYQYNNGVSSNYSFSDVVLTLDCDGTERSFTLTPSGSQYEFLNSSTSSSRMYGYIVPYSFFSVSEYQNCSVVKVDFTRTISSAGGSGSESFRISCDYRLKTTNINGNAQDFNNVTLAPVPSVTVAPDPSTVQDWSDNSSYHSPYFGHNGSYVLLNDLPIFPNWVDKYILDCTRVNKTVDGITLNLWIDLDNPYVSVNTALVDIPIAAFFTPESYLKDNVLTDFYDVVVFKVWSDTGKTSVDGYLYFYTEKYDLKYQNNLIVQELNLEYDSLNLLSSGFSLIRTGLDNIDNNTSAFFTDSLFNDTIIISWLQTLNNTNAFGFTDVINAIEDIPQYDDTSVLSGIASVVSAIEGIDSPDLSDLESKLDTLINFFVADGSTENASSRTYRNWLRGVDDNTQRTVTYYADNVFSIVHDVFDLFDADGSVYYPPDSEDVISTDYINFVKLFIEKMNSSTITNTEYNKYLRGFFQGGFDPHLIDGGL